MFDIGIIGSGPAALSAAINARQRNKSVCVFGRSLDSSLLFAAEKVDNYLGMPDMSGEEMLNQFYAHAVKRGVEVFAKKMPSHSTTSPSTSIPVTRIPSPTTALGLTFSTSTFSFRFSTG